MKLATWNVNSLAVRLPHVLQWLQSEQPDALVLQETKLTDDKFPQQALAEAGWQAAWFGQRTYNGVAILARLPIEQVQRNIPGLDDEQARVLCATVAGVRVIGAYFPNGQEPGSDDDRQLPRARHHHESVSRSADPYAKPFEFGDAGISSRGPHEGFAVLVVVGREPVDESAVFRGLDD